MGLLDLFSPSGISTSANSAGTFQPDFGPLDISNKLGSPFIVGGSGNTASTQDVSRNQGEAPNPSGFGNNTVLIIGIAAVAIISVFLLKR